MMVKLILSVSLNGDTEYIGVLNFENLCGRYHGEWYDIITCKISNHFDQSFRHTDIAHSNQNDLKQIFHF